MFNVSFPSQGREFRVEFKYRNKPVQFYQSGKLVDGTVLETTAFIYDVTEVSTWTESDALAFASVACDSRDNYDRNEGRKKALAQALINFTADRNVRREFWYEYTRAVAAKNSWAIDFTKDLS